MGKRESLAHRGTVKIDDSRESGDRYPWEDTAKSPYDPEPLVGTRKVQGKGRLLREDLRRLPGEYVTDDIHDPDAVHALDDEHVRDNLAEERWEKEKRGEDEEEPEDTAPHHQRVWGNQQAVDLLILMTTKGRIDSAKMLRDAGAYHWRDYLRHGHLWFEEDSTAIVEWRDGNPPADCDRPKHLRGLDLVADPMRITPRIVAMINSSPERRRLYAESVNQSIMQAETTAMNMVQSEVLRRYQ